MEDINNILNSGDVPNIYEFEDLDNIYNTMKPIVLDDGQQPTKANLFSAYTKRVRSNIHLVICMRYVLVHGYIGDVHTHISTHACPFTHAYILILTRMHTKLPLQFPQKTSSNEAV